MASFPPLSAAKRTPEALRRTSLATRSASFRSAEKVWQGHWAPSSMKGVQGSSAFSQPIRHWEKSFRLAAA